MLKNVYEGHLFAVAVGIQYVVEGDVVKGAVTHNLSGESAFIETFAHGSADQHLLRRINECRQNISQGGEAYVATDVDLGGETLCPEVHDAVTIDRTVRGQTVARKETTGRRRVKFAVAVFDLDEGESQTTEGPELRQL